MTERAPAWAPGPHFTLLSMEGPDSADFLNRLLTNELPPDARPRHAYYLNVQGRPLAEFWVMRKHDGFWLACPTVQAETALVELDKMHFGEKLRMRKSDLACTVVIGSAADPGQGVAMEIPYYAGGTTLVWTEQPLQLAGEPLSAEQLETLRVRAGTAGPGDIGEKTMFLEIVDEHAYSETKGCYPGQEVVARTLHRGHINRKLCRFSLSGPVPVGTALVSEGKEVGRLSTVVEGAALGFLRREAWEVGKRLECEGTGQTATLEAV